MGLFDSLIKKAQDAVTVKTEELTKKVEAVQEKIATTPLDVLIKEKETKQKSKRKTNATAFTPNTNKTEYENWLDFLDKGGTTEEWDDFKKANKWSFKISETEVFEKYQKEVKTVSNKYYALMEKIQKEWSAIYNLNDYFGSLADTLEKDCLLDISHYKKMREIDIKYGQKTPTNIPAFKRLAMLYEKQSEFEKSVVICKEAFYFGMDERSRMIRMIKKAGRTPTAEEMALLNN